MTKNAQRTVTMKKLAIVVVGYNRIPGMLRLLNSLNSADYLGDEIPLIISLDNCGSDSLKNAVEGFSWEHGSKIIRTFPTRQGLRKHILSCGDYLNEYDAIAVLEDDIIVSRSFYSYMKQSVEYYSENEDIAGISLFSPTSNIPRFLPFEAQRGDSDVYFMKYAQSWGQIWLKKQWFAFKEWYLSHESDDLSAYGSIPTAVSGWPATSWLKYHISYCSLENKYFVYPYHALSTCANDAGQHQKISDDKYNVPLAEPKDYKYTFTGVSEGVRYDTYYEREGLEEVLGITDGTLCCDIYGVKKDKENYDYILTRENLPYLEVKCFALSMRPHECNIIYGAEGREIKLYDRRVSSENKKKNKNAFAYKSVDYYYNISCKFTDVLRYAFYKIKCKIFKK